MQPSGFANAPRRAAADVPGGAASVSWTDMARGSHRAAQLLVADDPRSSVSRSYYAAYSAVTAALLAVGVRFRHGWRNPTHDEVPALVMARLTSVSPRIRTRLARGIRRLRKMRVEADYDPAALIDGELARNAFREAGRILSELGVEGDEEG